MIDEYENFQNRRVLYEPIGLCQGCRSDSILNLNTLKAPISGALDSSKPGILILPGPVGVVRFGFSSISVAPLTEAYRNSESI